MNKHPIYNKIENPEDKENIKFFNNLQKPNETVCGNGNGNGNFNKKRKMFAVNKQIANNEVKQKIVSKKTEIVGKPLPQGNNTGTIILNDKQDHIIINNNSIETQNIDKEIIQDNEINYLMRENENLIKSYGANLYNFSKFIENDTIPSSFLIRHKLNNEIRMRMVDWMVEVLSVYKSEQETFFLSIHIMDTFICKSPSIVKQEDVHLLGITSMFIASKMEDVIPIRLNSVVSKIGHDSFSA
jgi:hypothetical protein